MIPADRIYAIAEALLAAVEAHYLDPTIAADLPGRRYVANGLPAFDATDDGECDEQLTVFCETTYGIQGSPLLENPEARLADLGHAMRAAVFAVTIVRCVPTLSDQGTLPTVEAENESSSLIYEDAVLMLNALLVAERAGDLPGCGSVAFLRWQNENAQGGVGGGTLRVVVSLSDAF